MHFYYTNIIYYTSPDYHQSQRTDYGYWSMILVHGLILPDSWTMWLRGGVKTKTTKKWNFYDGVFFSKNQ